MKQEKLWIYLAHFGYNMWLEPRVDKNGVHNEAHYAFPDIGASDTLLFDEQLWKETVVPKLQSSGCNAILLDIGEGLKYDTHPELAVKGSWDKNRFHDELERLRGLGFEVFPKLNFSAAHDQWLGEYSRMVSTGIYYRVVEDLIREVSELFDHPRFFHIGMDEEKMELHPNNIYFVARLGEQWWYDFHKIVAFTEQAGCRAWCWSDVGWNHPRAFRQNMSKEVLQSNWYYGSFCHPLDSEAETMYRFYHQLAEWGFDQIPTASNVAHADNLLRTVEYCKPAVAPENLVGYMQAPWLATVQASAKAFNESIEGIKEAKAFDDQR